MKLKKLLFLSTLALGPQLEANTLYNFDMARNRGGVVFNAATDDCSLVWNTADPAGSSTMTWNLFNTGTNNLSGGTVSLSNLVSSSGAASGISISVGPVNSDGYSDQTPKDGVWTSYMTTGSADGAGPTITIGGFVEGQTINLVLYTGNARWSGVNSGDFTFDGTTKSYSEAVGSSTMPLTEGTTYVRFDGLVADSNGEISGTFGLGGEGSIAVLAGMQIEVVTNDVYWDGTGTTWTDPASWSLDPDATTPDPTAVPAETASAIVGTSAIASDQTITLDDNVSALGLSFVSSFETNLVGDGTDRTLVLGSGGVFVDAGALAPDIGSAVSGEGVDIVLGANQTWNNQSTFQPMVIHNDLMGDAWNLSLAGEGEFVFDGAFGGVDTLTVSAVGGATLNGDVEAPSTISNTSFVDINGGLGGSGALRKLGDGELWFNGTDSFSGNTTIDRGAIHLAGDRSAASGGWLLRGYGDSGTAFNTVPTQLAIDAGATLHIGSLETVQAGNSSPNGGFQAQVIDSAGTVTHDGQLLLGRSGTLNVSGGTWQQNGAANVTTFGGGVAALNVFSGASFTYAGGTDFGLHTSTSLNTQTLLGIDGGTFVTGRSVRNNTAAVTAGTYAGIVLANGGTLKLSADVADLMTTGGADIVFETAAGGGVVDTNGFSTTLNIPVSGVGGLIKDGAGTLTTTAENSYAGNTTVSAGTLVLSHPALADDSSVTVETGAMLQLDFAGADEIAGLTLGGEILGAGTYDATTHPALLSGTGQLVIPGSGFQSWATGLGLTGNANDDFDLDGLSDAIEYVIGTDPVVPDAGGIHAGGDENNLLITFERDDRSKTSDIVVTVEAGGDLLTWPSVYQIGASTAESSPGVTVEENGAAADSITVTIPKDGEESLFARIRVSVATP